MSIATESLPELAARAWKEAQERSEAARRERISRNRLEHREGLKGAIESTLRTTADLDAITCPLSDEQLENGVPDGGVLATTVIDGLSLALLRRGHSRRLALIRPCPECGRDTYTRVESLEDLGMALECQYDGYHVCRPQSQDDES